MSCTTDSTWTMGSSSHVLVFEGDQVDVHFQPLDLRDGEAVTAEAGSVRLESVAEGDSHHVTLSAPGRTVLSVTGLLDGEPRLSAAPEPTGGVTSAGPTSAHTVRVCRDDECSEHIEYDYDLHEPDGTGTTSWRTPDGRSATIDRLLFVLDAAPAQPPAQLRLVTPEPAVIVEASTEVQ